MFTPTVVQPLMQMRSRICTNHSSPHAIGLFTIGLPSHLWKRCWGFQNSPSWWWLSISSSHGWDEAFRSQRCALVASSCGTVLLTWGVSKVLSCRCWRGSIPPGWLDDTLLLQTAWEVYSYHWGFKSPCPPTHLLTYRKMSIRRSAYSRDLLILMMILILFISASICLTP